MFFTIPGLRNSGHDHWQTFWETQSPGQFKRIVQDNWEVPEKTAWVSRIQEVTSSYRDQDIILIGHSVGCAAIVHWYKIYRRKIKGALLVAPSDVDREDYPSYIQGFDPMPLDPLPFPSFVVASSNDHVVTPERAHFFARHWGSEFEQIENAGHIEGGNGYGPWEEGLKILHKFT